MASYFGIRRVVIKSNKIDFFTYATENEHHDDQRKVEKEQRLFVVDFERLKIKYRIKISFTKRNK